MDAVVLEDSLRDTLHHAEYGVLEIILAYQAAGLETAKTVGHYKEEVVKTFQSEAFEAIESYDALAAFNSARFPFLSQAFLSRMKGVYEQCKLMLKVTDKDLEIHSAQLQKLMKSMQGKEPADDPLLQVQEMTRRNAMLQQAIQEGENRR